MKVVPTLLLIAALALMTTTCVIAAPAVPEVWPTDPLGNPKGEFDVSDDVYVAGSGLPANTEITIYIMDPQLSIAVTSSPVTTDSDGSIPVTLVWSGPLYKITTAEGTIYRLRDYEYEIWADLNRNGQRDDGDALNVFTVIYPKSQHHTTTTSEPTSESNPGPNPEPVVPELGTMILMLAMFGALATAYLARKRLY
jgi:hypothetical protein